MALDVSGIFHTSLDGGTTWKAYNVSGNGTCRSFATARDGTVYVQTSDANSTPYAGVVLTSTDFGLSWSTPGATTGGDCFTLSADSCDAKRLYLVDEEYFQPSDGIPKMLLSTDGGQSWATTDARHSLSGAMSSTSDAIVVGTDDATNVGVFRSVDRGLTWQAIGGPALPVDSRNIAVINANIILAMDRDGSIWRTTNGGGDSVGMGASGFIYSESPQALFIADTLNLCNASMLDTVAIVASACIWPNVKSEQVFGPAAKDYKIIQPVSAPFSTHDTVIILFIPADTGLRTANYELTMDDGTVISVPLAGFGSASNRAHIVE